MATLKTFKDVVNSMLRFLHISRPNVDISAGTFTRDVVIDTIANELSMFYTDLNRVSNAQSPDLAAVTDVEALGRNFQLKRKGPVKATGIATFYSFDSPSSPITIPRGTTLATKAMEDGASQQFVTTQDVVLSSVSFNADTGRYEVNCSVRATVVGAAANIPPGTITAILTPVDGVAGVYNYNAISTGRGFEPLNTFRGRLKSVILGNSIGTEAGYYQTVIRHSNVIDAKVAALGTSAEALKRDDVGAVDIYIRGIVSSQADIETYIVPSSAPYRYIVSKQPIDLLVSSGFILIGSVTGTLVEGTHYTIVQDSSKLAGSIRAADKFVFTGLTAGEEVSITYSYNILVESLQTYMNSSVRKILGTDLLIKSAKPRQIDIECTIRLFSGYTATNVINNIESALSTLLNSYAIGEEVQQSDTLATIAAVDGVDDVNVPLDTFKESSTTGSLEQNALGNIIIPADSYAVAGDITVNVRTI